MHITQLRQTIFVLKNDTKRQGQFIRVLVEGICDSFDKNKEFAKDSRKKLRSDLINESSRQSRPDAPMPFSFYIGRNTLPKEV
jgi:hypothetical protein